MFKWKKIGKIFDPTSVQGRPWMHEFAQCTSTLIFNDFIRVYFSCRPIREDDGRVVSHTTFVDLDRQNLKKIVRIANSPILELGALGTFDEFGIYPSCVLRMNNLIYFYYAGWTRPMSVFADAAIGVAISNDGEKFYRLGQGPIISKTLNEPFQFSGPKVRIFNNKMYMFYLAGEKWVLTNDKRTETYYKIRLATSEDGLNWTRTGQNIIESILDNECQAGPDVFYYNNKYHMYFSYRYGLDFRNNNRGYRIGYAVSDDLINWVRDDENAGIGLSDVGWDSKDMHYPHVFECDGQIYMLYNGNEFGRFGFGLAVLD
ncbi:MAG: glycosylase [bacterium]|nr:glycosylase [bacterium]